MTPPPGNVPAAITGIGLITPAGVGVASNWATVCAGNPTTREVGILADAPVKFASVVSESFDADRLLGRKISRLYDRSTQLALVAAKSALHEAQITPDVTGDVRIAVVIGTAYGGVQTLEDNHARLLDAGPDAVNPRFLPKSMVNMVAGVLSIELKATGPSMVVSTACASGTTAIGVALTMLRSGQADIVIAGGTDASVTPLHIAGFNKLRGLSRASNYPPTFASSPFDAGHDGFVLAEGAAILVLERAADATARGVRPYAHLVGYGSAADAHHVTAPHPDQRGAKDAIRKACADAGLAPHDIEHFNAHATSTPAGDAAEARAIAATVPDAAVTAPKGVTGHTMGAAGAIEAAYTALSLRHQTIPPIANLNTPCDEAKDLDLVADRARHAKFGTALSSSFGFGGHIDVLAFARA